MKNETQIPVLSSENIDDFHFGNVEWKSYFENSSQLFHINRIEEITDKMQFPLPPHRKVVYDIVFLTKGNSIRSKGLNNYKFGKNQLFFLPAYQITSHEFMSEDAEGFFIHFDIEIFKKLNLENQINKFPFLDFFSNPIITIPEHHIQHILNIFQRLEILYKIEKKEDNGLIIFYLLVLFKEVSAFISNENQLPKSAASMLSNKYKEALSKHIYQIQTVTQYADLLHVTPNHLNKCIKTITGKSAQEFLNEMLILEAKSLLKYSNLNIAEIAVKLFNQTPSNFSRFFKSQTGLTPKEYNN